MEEVESRQEVGVGSKEVEMQETSIDIKLET